MIEALQARFERHASRHEGVAWTDVRKRLTPAVLEIVAAMEATGGEPDLVVIGKEWRYVDCAPESPSGRRSVCYDREALESRKVHRPADSAVDLARSLGIELLDEAQYRALQGVGEFDLKTSSWIRTPAPIRKLGGALFCDRRYGQVFTYHNGAQSYYAARGFRGCVKL